ncbi:MAG: SDR family oxidoreductase [Bellilinea sp.]
MPDFDINGKIAVVTGGTGVLGSAICRQLAAAGAKVAALGTRPERAEKLAKELGGESIGLACNVLEQDTLERAAQTVLQTFGRVDILINAAGGNKPEAVTSAQQSFFDLPAEAFRWVFDLNLTGAVFACQAFGKIMAAQKEGVILNVSSMNAYRPLTRIPAYSAAKAALNNFTQWLAVHMAQEYSPNIRVNAIAPGFFIGEQNRRLLLHEDGSLTPRAEQILAHTPMGRFGVPEDLLGAVLWLVSPASAFVTGAVIPIDGGFSAFSGV